MREARGTGDKRKMQEFIAGGDELVIIASVV
jgi:hypothetical protein